MPSGRLPPDYPRQIWFVAAMALALAAMVALIPLGVAPRSRKQVATLAPSATRALTATGTSKPSARVEPSPSATATTQPTPTATPTNTQTATATPTPTVPPSATPSATPAATETPPSDHYWLERPISPEGHDWVAHFYPYASRGDGTYPIHHGVEFVNPMDTPILATAAGTVIVAGDDLRQVYGARTDFYGQLVITELDHTFQGKPLYVLYGHLSEVLVDVGQRVKTGDVLGLVGMTGVAEGPHLHMEVRYGENDYGSTVNPELWVRPHQGHGTLAGLLLSPDGQPVAEAKIMLYQAGITGKPFRELTSYPDREVNSDPAWQENFVGGDLKAGRWRVEVYKNARLYTEIFTIEAGATSRLIIRLKQ